MQEMRIFITVIYVIIIVRLLRKNHYVIYVGNTIGICAMMINKDIALDVWENEAGDIHSVEISLDDFEYLLERALLREDEFILNILDKIDDIKEKEYEKITKS